MKHMTPNEFNDNIADIAANESFVYHRGFLAIDAYSNKALQQLRTHALIAGTDYGRPTGLGRNETEAKNMPTGLGIVYLTQRKSPDILSTFEYIATKRKRKRRR